MKALLLILYSVLSGASQGLITWLFTEYVPEKRQDWINAALHSGGALLYALFVYVLLADPLRVAHHFDEPHVLALWPLVAMALLLRWFVFDPVLTLAHNFANHRDGTPTRPLFFVGTSAFSDRVTRQVAGSLHLSPEALRTIEWVLALPALAWLWHLT